MTLMETSDPELEAVQAEAAKIQAEMTASGAMDPPAEEPMSPALAEALSDAGIEHTFTPKDEVAPEAPAEESDLEGKANEATEPDTTGTDALADAMTGRLSREERIANKDEIRERALAAGLPKGVASALANNVSRKEAEEFLASQGNTVQSQPAGQPAAPTSAPLPGAAVGAQLAEVREALSGSLGEEAASAVTGILSGLEARVAQAEMLSVQTTESVAVREAKTQALQVAGELSAQWPQLVRAGDIDPAVGPVAAALFASGPYKGDVREAMSAACRLAYGGEAPPPSQDNQPTRTKVEAPTSTGALPAKRISEAEFASGAAQIAHKFRNDDAALDRALSAYSSRVRAHNAAL